MSPPRDLPIVGQCDRVRADAERNRVALLEAASALVERCGVGAVTMEAVAEAAGVGKGTVFRRFTSRAGLMAALLDHIEAAFQAAVLSGPPPLGPGADPLRRLLAFGPARLEHNLTHAALLEAAGAAGSRSYAAFSFTALHVRHLLGELDTGGDVALLATALLAPLEVPILVQQTEVEGMDPTRIERGWADLVARVIRRPSG